MSTAAPVPRPRQPPPGPPARRGFSHIRAFREDALTFLLGLAREHGDVVRFHLGPQPLIFVSSPEAVRHVMQDNARNYTKQTPGFDVVRELLRQGLLTSDGELWIRQRRLAQPAFHRQKLAGFGRLMMEAAVERAEAWAPEIGTGKPLDVSGEMMRLALRMAGDALFGTTDVLRAANEIRDALDVVLAYAHNRITKPLTLPRSVPTPFNLKVNRAVAALDGVVFSVIEQRRREPKPREDLLAMLMEATDADTGERMGDAQLRDEVMTLLLAGHETTANTLSWTWYMLSMHPMVRRTLQAELASVLGGRPPTVEDMPKLVYTRMVIDEVLRLYPPAWVFSRSPLQDDEIGGFHIPKGGFVVISPWVTHHHPKFWENPTGFDPERFRPERAAAQPRFAYFPFGGGPRLCIGQGFALMELVMAIATLAQRMNLDLIPDRPVVPEFSITLRPRGGLWMTANPVV